MTVNDDRRSTATPNQPRIQVHCPADGRLVGSIPDQNPTAVAAEAQRLRAAQPAWEELGPRGRGRHMHALLDWILDNERRLVALAQNESGKSWGDASVEVGIAVELINYYAKNAEDFLADRGVTSWRPSALTKRLGVQVRPHQLVGMLTPWNGPLGGPLLDGVPALMAGCAVLFKPSEFASLTWVEVSRGWREDLGAPEVLGTVTGGPATGAAVVDAVDFVAFTGSVSTGRLVARRAADRLVPVSLELGGNDPMIVFADANLEKAAAAATFGAMFNAGQTCVSVERVYVEAAVHDEFVDLLVDRVGRLRQGMDDEGAFATDVGAIATQAQLDVVEGHVTDAVANGARVLTGGSRLAEGLFFAPTVLVDVDHDMRCMRGETFGPTLPVMRFSGETDAVRLANDSSFGLSASVWTGDAERADRVARRLDCGSVNVNTVLSAPFQLALPMEGWKSSGLGSRSGGAAGMLKYCRQKAIVSELPLGLTSEPFWYPHSRRKRETQSRALRFIGAHDWRRRFGRPKR